MRTQELVTVVVPAYNAAATIDQTIRSIRSQTYDNLEIIVVDDGSTDKTAEIVAPHARADLRIRLLHQGNGGVAAARNLGWRNSKGNLLAFIDADDLWAVDKIEKQVAALGEASKDTALVYTWYEEIDGNNSIIGSFNPTACGDVLEALLLSNFIGNGSSALMTREAISSVGGYNLSLRARRAQGCEDYLLYLRLAERYRFALVPERLTGYRRTPTNMSSDHCRMLRSWRLVAEEMHRRHPQLRRIIAKGINYYAAWLIERAILARNPFEVARIALPLSFKRPDLVVRAFTRKAPDVPGGRWADLSALRELRPSALRRPGVAR